MTLYCAAAFRVLVLGLSREKSCDSQVMTMSCAIDLEQSTWITLFGHTLQERLTPSAVSHRVSAFHPYNTLGLQVQDVGFTVSP